MPKLKYSVAIPAKDYVDALNKVQKFVKRGFLADTEWNTSTTVKTLARYYVVVFANESTGQVAIHSHRGCGVEVILNRVRDVEQHYVKD